MIKKGLLLTLAVAIGVVVGWGISQCSNSHIQGHYFARSASMYKSEQGNTFNESSVNVEFKTNGHYDLLYLTNKQVGFTSSGQYIVSPVSISLQEDNHDKIVPSRELAFYEQVMVSQGAILSSDMMEYVKLNEFEILLMTQYGITHFCKGRPCSELERYSH
ncbi:hypothetical protein J4N42_17790 [Vibrio sp. SCSIO 43135]|uniref:hypothetical protein n=1 Tax=Vibrio sp. SCSIO 43135 TaxID=2819096 RepID=UPI002074CFB1|nr:hypothetical protein [Vibrio sp. SCSIO 43135]USD43998.1 hypothetical protein J4N42_17790 [Vibrio sp. SCSIO 43135]